MQEVVGSTPIGSSILDPLLAPFIAFPPPSTLLTFHYVRGLSPAFIQQGIQHLRRSLLPVRLPSRLLARSPGPVDPLRFACRLVGSRRCRASSWPNVAVSSQLLRSPGQLSYHRHTGDVRLVERVPVRSTVFILHSRYPHPLRYRVRSRFRATGFHVHRSLPAKVGIHDGYTSMKHTKTHCLITGRITSRRVHRSP